jgi:predicted amidohydrolase
MRPSSSALRVGLAQIDSRLGDVERNVESHLEFIRQARAEGVELLVFPELSLTGYRLLHLTSRVAVRPADSSAVRAIAEAADGMAVILGLVEDGDDGALYNSALFLRGGVIAHVHRKVYLPTYGLFQEKRFFGEGQELGVVALDAAGSTCGILICEDLWHAETARKLARGGAKLLIVVSASPGRIGPGERPESLDDWEILTRSAALLNTSWVAYCNRVGWEEGSFYTGGSHFVRPGGEVFSRAPVLDPHLLIADLDLREVDRLRFRLPLLREERPEIRGPVVKRDASGGAAS